MKIDCPGINIGYGLRVRNEQLFNRLGEEMLIVAADEDSGHRFETLSVLRLTEDYVEEES